MDFDGDDDEALVNLLDELDDQNDQINDAEIDEPRTEHIECLEKCFGHTDFRPSQWKVIRSIIEDKRDNCTIMATGYGKSLCFQFPPVFSNGISLIISPLISLMQDQVKSLNIVNIPSCMLGSAQTNKLIENDIIRGDYRIVYASPEYITGSGSHLVGKLKDKLTLIAVDEAHCVSKWGCDFRPKYLELKNIRADAPNIPILAVTATASERVQKDICACLNLINPQIICTGFDRPNLEIIVRNRTKDPWKDIEMVLRSKLLATASCIIYCLTRKATEKICSLLQRNGLKCGAYHAGKTLSQRKDVYDKFIRDEINIVVATVAFGMGIDKSDIRCVIHYGAPSDIDSYYQEIGRAGRDGVQSKCVLFYTDNDFHIHRQLWKNSSQRFRETSENRMKLMRDFVVTRGCRRLKILQYFDGPTAQCPKHDICCDNCRIAKDPSKHNEGVDFSKETKIMLDVINLFNGQTGLSKPLSVLRGSTAKSVGRYRNHKLMGSGKHKPEEYWKILADLLEQEGFLERKHQNNSGFSYMSIELTSRGREWLKDNNSTLKIVPDNRMIQLIKSANFTSTSSSSVKPLYDTSISSHGTMPVAQSSNNSHQELKNKLLTVRAMIASREGTMPYKIALEPAIDRLARLQPLNLQELRDAKVEGFSEAIINQFGIEFLHCILKSKGLIPQEYVATQQHSVPATEEKENRATVHSNSKVSETCNENESAIITHNNDNASAIENVKPTIIDYKDAFNDDDDLFMMIDCENTQESSSVSKPDKNNELPKRLIKVTNTVSKRVKYDVCSSDDDDSSMNQHNERNRSQAPSLVPPKKMGIPKRKIF